MPLISPALFFAVVTTIIVVLDEIVGAVDVLTEGGPYRTSSNLLYFLYERGFRHFQFGEAAAVAVLIAAIVARRHLGAVPASGSGMSTTTRTRSSAHRASARRLSSPLHVAFVVACLVDAASRWPGCCAPPSRRLKDVFRATPVAVARQRDAGQLPRGLPPASGRDVVRQLDDRGRGRASPLGKLVVSIPAAFAFGVLTSAAATLAFALVVGTMTVPYVITLLPTYVAVASIGLLRHPDRRRSCRRPAIAASVVFFLRQAFKSLPRELFEAARIDGAGPVAPDAGPSRCPTSGAPSRPWRCCRSSVPGTSICGRTSSSTPREHKTLSIGLKLFATTGEQGGQWGPLMATALLAALPVVAALSRWRSASSCRPSPPQACADVSCV